MNGGSELLGAPIHIGNAFRSASMKIASCRTYRWLHAPSVILRLTRWISIQERQSHGTSPGVRAGAHLVDEIFPAGVPPDMQFFKGTGCEHCRGTGCYGRIAAIEYLPASPELRLAIAHRATVDELRSHALRAGLLPLRDHALMLVRDGIIPLEELKMMLPPERLAPERD